MQASSDEELATIEEHHVTLEARRDRRLADHRARRVVEAEQALAERGVDPSALNHDLHRAFGLALAEEAIDLEGPPLSHASIDPSKRDDLRVQAEQKERPVFLHDPSRKNAERLEGARRP